MSNFEEREAVITESPEFNYKNTPDGTQEDMRYVFHHKVCLGQLEAYAYAMECREQMRAAEIDAKVTGSVGAVRQKIDTDGTMLGYADYTRPAKPLPARVKTAIAREVIWP